MMRILHSHMCLSASLPLPGGGAALHQRIIGNVALQGGAPWDWRGFFGPHWLLGLHGAPIHPTSPVYRLILDVPLSWATRLLTQPPMSTFTKPRGHGLNWVNMVYCVYESIYCVHVYDCFCFFSRSYTLHFSHLCPKAKVWAHFTVVGCVCLLPVVSQVQGLV